MQETCPCRRASWKQWINTFPLRILPLFRYESCAFFASFSEICYYNNLRKLLGWWFNLQRLWMGIKWIIMKAWLLRTVLMKVRFFNYLIWMCREIIWIINLERKFGYPIPDGNCSNGALHLLVGANYFWQQLFRHLGDQRGEQSQPSAIEFHLLGLRRAG